MNKEREIELASLV